MNDQTFTEIDDEKAAVVCLSGGMDSTSLLLHLLSKGISVHAISFNYGQRHVYELQCLDRNLGYFSKHGHTISHERLDLSVIGKIYHSALLDNDDELPLGYYESENMKATVVPNRNAIFASIAFGYALSIANRTNHPVLMSLGVHSGDHSIYPDCRPNFYRSLYEAFQLGNWDSDQVRFYMPFLNFDKADILTDAQKSCQQLKLNFETVFANTCTSYQPGADGKAHGMTGSDVERILAFDKIGLKDPIQYQHRWEEVLEKAKSLEAEAIANTNRSE